MNISLTRAEVLLAAQVGCRRHERNLWAGHRTRGIANAWDHHILGAIGELAFAKSQGRYWSGAGVGIEDDDDVGGVQVRCRGRHSFDLYLWPDETSLTARFVLVTFEAGPGRYDAIVHGYIWAAQATAYPLTNYDGRSEKAHFVPQGDLVPL